MISNVTGKFDQFNATLVKEENETDLSNAKISFETDIAA